MYRYERHGRKVIPYFNVSTNEPSLALSQINIITTYNDLFNNVRYNAKQMNILSFPICFFGSFRKEYLSVNWIFQTIDEYFIFSGWKFFEIR